MLKQTLACALAVGCAGPALTAQSGFPADMVASFNSTWADEFYLPVPAGSIVTCKLTFENQSEPGKVHLQWRFSNDGALMRSLKQTVEVSFRPTAIAKRAGETDTFYVAGWSERAGRVLIEEWTLGEGLLGTIVPEGGAEPAISTFTPPPITRVVEWISEQGTPPLWDIACQPYDNSLILLPSGPVAKLWSLDLTTHELTLLYSAATMPTLTGHRMLGAGKHPTAGFIVLTERRKQWEHAQDYMQELDYFVMRDTNLDGLFDLEEAVPNNVFHYLFPAPWQAHYTGQ